MSKLCSEVNQICCNIKIAKRNGDRNALNAAFQDLYDLTHDNLRIFARTFLKDPSEDMACVNDAYARVYQYIETNDPEKDGYNWLITITRHAALDANKAYRPYVSLDALSECIPDKKFSLEDHIDKLDLQNALKHLSLLDRRLVQLVYYDMRSVKEICGCLLISRSKLFRHLHKITDVLRNNLKNFEKK